MCLQDVKSDHYMEFFKENISEVMFLAFKDKKKKSANRHVGILNTHIHSKPANSDVKLCQVNYLLTTLKELVCKQEKVIDHIPLVLCGGFNSVSDNVVHSLLSESQDFKNYNHPNMTALEALRVLRIHLQCPWILEEQTNHEETEFSL